MSNDSPNYRLIAKRLFEGKIVPFLGAGASFGTRNPSKMPWRDKTQKVIALPTASELAAYLADEAKFPEKNPTDLAKVAQFYDTTVGRGDLMDELNAIFTCGQKPGPIHNYLAEAAKHAPQLIVTTNYDDLMEQALQDAKQPYDVVIHVTRTTDTGMIVWKRDGQAPVELLAKDLDIDLSKTNVLYKIHGAIDRDAAHQHAHYVITEDDYVDFLSRMQIAIPNIFAEPFQKRHFLFIGYGLQDWNVRVVLNRIANLRGAATQTSWAIETRPKPVEKKLWNARKIEIYDATSINTFVKNLRAARDKR